MAEYPDIDDLQRIEDIVWYYVDGGNEDVNVEQKREMRLGAKRDRAEVIRDLLHLANPPAPDYVTTALLIVGAKGTRVFYGPEDRIVEDTDVRNLVDSYVFPTLDFDYHEFTRGTGKVGAFRIRRTGTIYEVNKDLRENEKDLLVAGQSWTRRGTKKVILPPDQRHRLRNLAIAPSIPVRAPALALRLFGRDGVLRESVESGLCSSVFEPILEVMRGDVSEHFEYADQTAVQKPDPVDESADPSLAPFGVMIVSISGVGGRNKSTSPPIGIWGKPVKVDQDVQNMIRAYASSLLEVELGEAFFDLGGLRSDQGIRVKEDDEREFDYHGSDSEKRKHSAIQHLATALPELGGVLAVANRLANVRYLAFALVNTGTAYDEDIRILIRMPQSVRVVVPDDLKPAPEPQAVHRLIRPGGILRSFLYPEETDRVAVVMSNPETRFPNAAIMLAAERASYDAFVEGVLNHRFVR